MRFLLFCLFICALPSPFSAQEVTVLPGYDEAIEWMESIDWWGENSRAKQLTVPRTLLIGISPRRREQAPQMPVAQKKEFFYRCLLPLVVHANTMVLDRRDRLAGLDGLLSRGKMAPARIVEQKKSGEFEKTRTYASRVTDHQHL